jgi:hypothetical protein
MKNLSLLLFLCACLFGLMALMPEGPKPDRYITGFEDEGRSPASIGELTEIMPASGEPSDNGLTQGLHREFREVMNRDPATAVTMARQLVFTRELDPKFRLTVLRELRVMQFDRSDILVLADDIIDRAPDTNLFHEALSIRSASMSEEEFEVLLSEIARKKESPEYRAILDEFRVKADHPT